MVALDAGAEAQLGELELEPPVVVCLGAEREGLEEGVAEAVEVSARIPMRHPGPDSLNVAMAATIALYEVANRMAARA
jgi:tRNA G18 (ribose-2'-O)-methylase SpoU